MLEPNRMNGNPFPRTRLARSESQEVDLIVIGQVLRCLPCNTRYSTSKRGEQRGRNQKASQLQAQAPNDHDYKPSIYRPH